MSKPDKCNGYRPTHVRDEMDVILLTHTPEQVAKLFEEVKPKVDLSKPPIKVEIYFGTK